MRRGDNLHAFDQELISQLCGNVAQIPHYAFYHYSGRPGEQEFLQHYHDSIPEDLRYHIIIVENLKYTKFVLDSNELLIIQSTIETMPDDIQINWKNNSLIMQKWSATFGEVLKCTPLGAKMKIRLPGT